MRRLDNKLKILHTVKHLGYGNSVKFSTKECRDAFSPTGENDGSIFTFISALNGHEIGPSFTVEEHMQSEFGSEVSFTEDDSDNYVITRKREFCVQCLGQGFYEEIKYIDLKNVGITPGGISPSSIVSESITVKCECQND